MPFSYAYPRPAVTCDTVVFTMRANDLAVLLVQRNNDPFKGHWALPGGFVNENEALERAAARELSEETGLTGARLEQLGAFGEPGRDPRGHTITVAWVTYLVAESKITAGDDAAAAEWHAFRTLALDGARPGGRPLPAASKKKSAAPPATTSKKKTAASPSPPRRGSKIHLAFDHAYIVTRAYERLCTHLDDPVRDRTFELFPSRFTLAELQRFYEVVLGKAVPARSFRNRFVEHGLVIPASSKPTPKAADQLYRWNRR